MQTVYNTTARYVHKYNYVSFRSTSAGKVDVCGGGKKGEDADGC